MTAIKHPILNPFRADQLKKSRKFYLHALLLLFMNTFWEIYEGVNDRDH